MPANDHDAFHVDEVPFAGHGHSGYGIGEIGYIMHNMVQPKVAMLKE